MLTPTVRSASLGNRAGMVMAAGHLGKCEAAGDLNRRGAAGGPIARADLVGRTYSQGVSRARMGWQLLLLQDQM